MRLRFHVGPNAFGNALGSSIVDVITRPDRQIDARVKQMNLLAKERGVELDQSEAQRIARAEYELSRDPSSFTNARQAQHVDDLMRMYGANDSDRAGMQKLLTESQKGSPSPVAPSAPIEALPSAVSPPPLEAASGWDIEKTVVIKERLPEISAVGQFFQDWQNPLATAGRMSAKFGEFISENTWAKYGLTVVEALTSPALFVGRRLFDATDFGKQFNEKLEAVSAEVMESGTEFVNRRGRIGDLQKSGEIVGGLMLGVGLAVGGIQSFTKLAPKIGSYLGDVTSKIGRSLADHIERNGIKVKIGGTTLFNSEQYKLHAVPPSPSLQNASKKLQVGKVDEYGNLQKVTGDGSVHRDHQPSKAALLARAEEIKGDTLTPAERNRIIARSEAVTVPSEIHRAGPTYGARNTPEQIALDKADLSAARLRDANVMIENSETMAPQHLNSLTDAAKSMGKTNTEYDIWLNKLLD